MKNIRGKFLIRKGKLKTGERCFVIAGVSTITDFNIDDIADSDEMWVCDVTINDGLKFTNPIDGVGSIEDFLEGKNQKTEDWKIKEKL